MRNLTTSEVLAQYADMHEYATDHQDRHYRQPASLIVHSVLSNLSEEEFWSLTDAANEEFDPRDLDPYYMDLQEIESELAAFGPQHPGRVQFLEMLQYSYHEYNQHVCDFYYEQDRKH